MAHKSILFKCYVIYSVCTYKNRCRNSPPERRAPRPPLYVHTKIGAETVVFASCQSIADLYVHTKIGAETVPPSQSYIGQNLYVHTKIGAETVVFLTDFDEFL